MTRGDIYLVSLDPKNAEEYLTGLTGLTPVEWKTQ